MAGPEPVISLQNEELLDVKADAGAVFRGGPS